jgi:hypothetical protein
MPAGLNGMRTFAVDFDDIGWGFSPTLHMTFVSFFLHAMTCGRRVTEISTDKTQAMRFSIGGGP